MEITSRIFMIFSMCFYVLFGVTLAVDAKEKFNPYLNLLQKSERLSSALSSSWGCAKDSSMGGINDRCQVGGIGKRQHSLSADQFPILIETQNPDETAAAICSLGGSTSRPIGNILPAIVSRETLLNLSHANEIDRIEAVPPYHVLLDISRPEIRADLVESGFNLPFPVDGSGVIVGLVDTGVDYSHKDFQWSGGQSKILQIWDQVFGTGNPPEGHQSGSLCNRDSIVLGICDSIDVLGHGTHVASTMVGTSSAYRGIAPGADLMAVSSIDFSLLTESVTWLFDEAQKLNKPMVINLSLGGHYGPHDGTDLETSALSQLTGPGRIIVAAAGNEGSDYIHLGYDPNMGTGVGKTLFVVYPGLDAKVALFDVWYDEASELSFAIGVQRQDAEVAETQFVLGTGSSQQVALQHNTTALGQVLFQTAGGLNAGNHKVQLDILVEPSDDALYKNPAGYEWYIKVKGSGPFDAWSAAAGMLAPPAHFSSRSDLGLIPGDNQKSVVAPAVGKGIIAVASYSTKNTWTDRVGTSQQFDEITFGDLSFFSSKGPSANPDLTGHKPEIAAPGEYIVAAYSQSSPELQPGTRVGEDHVAMRGTSMSSPHVAGIVALLLQVDPTLDPDRIRSLLFSTSKKDSFTGSDLPDFRWGFGKADAYEAVAKLLGVGMCATREDCAKGYTCGAIGRCEKEKPGCGCNDGSSQVEPLLGAAFVILWGWLRRRRLER